MRIGGTSILALSLGTSDIVCAICEVRGNSRVTRKIARFEATGPLLDRPESTGQALAAFLDQHKFNVHRTIVGVPAKWVIAAEKDLPPTDRAAAAAILRLQAERMAMSDAGSLVVDTAGEISTAGGRVLLVGMMRPQLEKIQKLVDAAKLNLVAICPTALATSAMIEADHAMLRLGEGGAELVQWQGGVARALRPLAASDLSQLALETKRFLAIRGQSGRVRLCDGIGLSGAEARTLSQQIGASADAITPAELNATIDPTAMNGFAQAIGESGHLPAVALSLAGLDEKRLPVNFLDSRLAPEKTARFGRTSYLAAAAVIAGIVGIVVLVMTVHAREAEEIELNDRLKSMSKEVALAESRLEQFRFGRQYFEGREGYLDCWRELATAFNYDEPIWTTSLTLRSTGEGQLMGKSTDQRLILALRDRLMNNKAFSKVQLLDLREAGGRTNEITWSISFVFGQTEVKK